MTPIPSNPNAVALVDYQGNVIALASNIAPDFVLTTVTRRSAFIMAAANKPFDSTRKQPEEQVMSSAASHARYTK